MTQPALVPGPGPQADPGRLQGGALRLALAAAGLIGLLMLITALRSVGAGGARSDSAAVPAPSGSAVLADISGGPVDVTRFLVPDPGPAPALALTDQDELPFDLAALRGTPVFVFFGYTHCPDVCPATVGTVGLAMEAIGSPSRAVFVTVDPERDTPAWLHEYVRYLAKGFVGVTGTPERIAAVAGDWGVRYARVETGTPGEYSMSHTADVLLVDANGDLRARFPFGTTADAMTATLRVVTASAAGSPAPRPTVAPPTVPPAIPASPAPASGGLDVLVGSSSVWAGPAGPIILSLSAGGIRIDDPDLVATVQLTSIDGVPVGPAMAAIAVRPAGETRILYVASPAIPTPGWWRLTVTVARGGFALTGSTDVAALDPGSTAAIGAAAPTVHTPTIDDAGGIVKAVTTDPAPDLRLSQTSTTDALAAHQPFVLVVDSWKFRVTSACGKALVMARYLADRWPDDAFIHLEPLRYDVITDTPVLEGSLGDPTLTDAAAGWGLAGDPWGPTLMPWVFVVDGNGIVRAKAEGVMGSDDVDVILALIAAGH
jgi:protein SCO1/2